MHSIAHWLDTLLNIATQSGSGWRGTYVSWEKARKASTGFDRVNILEHVRDATLRVRDGEAAYERDSVCFDSIQYSWPLLACLLYVAAQNNGRLNVVDFGGALGSTYFQNRRFLTGLHEVNWNIVEQPHFCECGSKLFASKELHFFSQIDACPAPYDTSVVIFSGVLQYLEQPLEILVEVLHKKYRYILIDRTGFTRNDTDRLTVQKVPSSIYNASYPCWFFSKSNFLAVFTSPYRLIEEFDSDFDGFNEIHRKLKYRGFFFHREVST